MIGLNKLIILRKIKKLQTAKAESIEHERNLIFLAVDLKKLSFLVFANYSLN
jgi:hypothetical protein